MLKLPLRDVFVKREKRFVLLDAGCERAAFRADSKLLEVGCAGGEAAAHMAELGYSKLTAVDIDADIIAEARKKAPDCDFACADACALPFESGSFDGIYSEASFALISDKSMAAEEYFRVLKKGGRVLLNEFALRIRTDSRRRSVEGIPMLMGVQTMERKGRVPGACPHRDEFGQGLRHPSRRGGGIYSRLLWRG